MIDEKNMKPNTAYMKDDDGNVYEVEADIWCRVGEPINEPEETQSGEVDSDVESLVLGNGKMISWEQYSLSIKGCRCW